MANLFELSATLGLDTSEFVESINSARTTARQAQQEFRQTFNQTSTETQRSANSAASALQNMFSFSGAQLLTSAIQTATSAIKTFAASSISAASDLVEVQNVVDVTFGSSTNTINNWAKAAVNAYGLSETKAKQYTSTIGAMLKSMGIDGAEITKMSTDLAGLAADMASFYNLDYDEAFSKIRSGLSGETEPLKQLGINMNVANLEAYALSQGIDTAYDKMSQAEQATLRYQYLLEATEDAQGDFSRTSDSYSNEMRKLETNLERIKAEFGQGLLAVVTPALSLLNDALSGGSYQYTDVEQIMRTRNAAINENDVSYAQAEGILDIMDGMIDAGGAAATATDGWTNALEALLDVMPGLSKYVDLTTSAITSNTREVDAYVTSLYNLQEYEAYKTAVDSAQTLVDSYESKIKELTAERDQLQMTITAGGEVLYAQKVAAADEAWEALAKTQGWDLDRNSEEAQRQYAQSMMNSSYWSGQYFWNTSAAQAKTAYSEALRALEDNEYTEAETQIAALNAEIAEQEKMLAGASAALKQAQEDLDGFTGTEAGASAELQSQFDTAASAELAAIDNVKDALTSLQEYYDTTYNEILEKYRGTVTQFGYMVTYTKDEMDELLRTTYSTENVTSWWTNNADTMNTYVDQLEYLREQGMSDEILSGLTTWSKDNSALVARYYQMLLSGDYSAEDINALWKESQSAEERIAQFATDLQLDNSPEYQALLDGAAVLVDAFNLADDATTNLASTTDAVLMGIDSLNTQLQPKIAETQALLASIFGDAYTLNNGTAGLTDTVYTESGSSSRMSYIRRDKLPTLTRSTGIPSSGYSYIRNDKTPVASSGLFSLFTGATGSTSYGGEDSLGAYDLVSLLGEVRQPGSGTHRSSGTTHGGGGRSFGDSYEAQTNAMQFASFGSDQMIVEISAESAAAIAAAISGVNISNTFEVDGQAIAVQIAPMVNKQIGAGVRKNILTTKD